MLSVPSEDWISAALSEEQKQPLSDTGNRASILAAAGSGKTKTLIYLLAHDLCLGTPASSIVVFTFTEKAADELLTRIYTLRNQEMPTIDLSGMFIGTIHSWCLQYLYTQPAFYNVTPIDPLHLEVLVGRLYDVLGLENIYGKRFPKGIAPFLADVEIFYNEHLKLEEAPSAVQPAISSFMEILEENRFLTFGGMVRSAIENLEETGSLTDLRALFVDEYQDVNPAQTMLIKAMLPPDGKLRVVGDDLQSIYNWRGSDVTRILDFPNDFKPANVYRLSRNYRSRPEVVAIANGVAEDISLKDFQKVMQPDRKESGQKIVHWISTNDELEQAEAIAKIITRFHDAGVQYSKMAILLRSVTSAGRPIYDVLKASGIPVECPMLSRGGMFINTFLLPVMEWLCTDQPEPKNKQEEEEQDARANLLWLSVAPWMLEKEDTEHIFWKELNHWHDLIRNGGNDAYNVRKCLYAFLDSCEIRIAPSDTDFMVGIGIASQIIRRVEEAHRRRIEGHTRCSAAKLIREIRYSLSRNQDDFGESLPPNQHRDGVILTTVHQAKGLEWPVVCLPMLNQRRFPLANRKVQSSFPSSISDKYGTCLDDERRLFYVAVTRARERLFMLDAAAHDNRRRSIFLADLKYRNLLPNEGLPDLPDSTWSIAADDLLNRDEPPIRIGLSDLLLYLECPYQYGLRRIAGLQPEVGDELGFGKGLHELLQRRAESNRAWNREEVVNQVEKHVHMPLASNETERVAKRAIAKRIGSLDKINAFKSKFLQEMQVEIFLGSGIVTGIIDFAYTRPDGSLVVRDWKTNIHEDFMLRYTRQLQVYVHALREQKQTVTGAELVDVAASTKAQALVTTDIDVDATTISALMEECQQALQGIQKGVFNPQPSARVCGMCDVRQICAVREGTQT